MAPVAARCSTPQPVHSKTRSKLLQTGCATVFGMMPPAHHGWSGGPDEASSLPLVLLPGTLCDDRVFAPMLACLRRDLPGLVTQVLRFDSCDSTTAAADHILQHAPEHFALLGFSLGGIVALHVAASASERVRGIALLDSAMSPVPEPQRGGRQAQSEEAQRIGLRSYLEQYLWPTYVAATRQGDLTLQDQMHRMAASLGIEAYQRQTNLALNRPDSHPLLRSLPMPALVVAGEEDRICPPEVQWALAAALPNATLAIVPAAGHFVVMEKPDVVAAHVAAWFNTLER